MSSSNQVDHTVFLKIYSRILHQIGLIAVYLRAIYKFSSHPLPVSTDTDNIRNFGPLRVGFGVLGVDFGPLGVDVGHLGVNFGPLEVDFRHDGEFRLLGFDFRALGVDHEPRGVHIWSL